MVEQARENHSESQAAIINLLQKQRLVEGMVHRQDMPKHELVEALVRKQNLAKLQQIVNHLPPEEVARILESLPPNDQLFLWDQLELGKKEDVLQEVSLPVIELLGKRDYKTENSRVKVFEMEDGRLHEVVWTSLDDIRHAGPVWIDMVDPTFEDRAWVGAVFGTVIPDPEKLGDLESSAKFFIEENGEVHLRSAFLIGMQQQARNIPVAFILRGDLLLSIRKEELPVFRLQRLRAMTQRGYINDSRDLLLNLYAADVEFSAEALEEVYLGLEKVGDQVLNKQLSDEEAAGTLTFVAREEDLNGRIRRNLLDTRRAVTFLMRAKLLEKNQAEDCQQILRDIDSLDGHTAFLFDKINFLMDATVGFININQNKVIKRLTVLSVVFMPLNVIAGIGGMSEFSMMTQAIPWPLSYALFVIGICGVAWATYEILTYFERREQIRNASLHARRLPA